VRDRGADETEGSGRRFMRWRANLVPARRWALDLLVFAVVGLMFWLEALDFFHFIGL